jgi:hypothetical protein
VSLAHDLVLKGISLPGGQYTVRWETNSSGATIEFVQHHKVVLSTERGFEERSKGYNRHDSVVYNTASDGTISLVEIRFAYSNKVLVFNQEIPQLKAAK